MGLLYVNIKAKNIEKKMVYETLTDSWFCQAGIAKTSDGCVTSEIGKSFVDDTSQTHSLGPFLKQIQKSNVTVFEMIWNPLHLV